MGNINVNYYYLNKLSSLVYLVCLCAPIKLMCFLSQKQPLSATNFLYELDKITQEIVTVSYSQFVFLPIYTTAKLCIKQSVFITTLT